MKTKVIFFLCILFSGFLQAQQQSFRPISEVDSLLYSMGSVTFAKVFEAPADWVSITLRPEELDNLSKYDCSKLTSLQSVYIEYTCDPEWSWAKRKKFIAETKRHLKNLSLLVTCPKLACIIFHIGELIYLNPKEQKEARKLQESDQPYPAYDLNIERAWENYGASLSKALPKVRLYAYNWNW
ncbi:MAG: hypothetical protein ACRCYO_10045 [Bacteroidia bacterium]